MVPVERAELATQDMDLIADLIRQIYVEHKATFRCPDPAQVNGDLRSATADGLNAGLLGYGGFEYTAELLPISSPLAVVVLRARGSLLPHAKNGGSPLVTCSWFPPTCRR